MKRIELISFFSGGGFLDMGFEQAGFKIIFSNELDDDFALFYNQGMSSWSGEDRKIDVIDDINNIDEDFIKKIKPHFFGIIGGPPCQDFSIRGSRNGFEGLRGTLTFHFYEKIMDLQPDFFLMENVPGLVSLKKTRNSFLSILELFRDQYYISSKILNSLHFSVPQNRERLFVVGVKKSLVINPSIEMLGNNWYNWPNPTEPDAEKRYKWGEPKGRPNKIDFDNRIEPPNKLCVDNILINDIEMRVIPNANEYFKLKKLCKVKKIEEGDTYRPSFKRLHRNKYSPTACYGNNEVHLHPYKNRRLSVRESLRLQGVPDSYVIAEPGKLSKKFKMIGNGVPVPLAFHVARSIKEFLNSPHVNQVIKNGYLAKEKKE